MPTMGAHLGVDAMKLQWIISAYAVGSVRLPLYLSL